MIAIRKNKEASILNGSLGGKKINPNLDSMDHLKKERTAAVWLRHEGDL